MQERPRTSQVIRYRGGATSAADDEELIVQVDKPPQLSNRISRGLDSEQ